MTNEERVHIKLVHAKGEKARAEVYALDEVGFRVPNPEEDYTADEFSVWTEAIETYMRMSRSRRWAWVKDVLDNYQR